jgi:hypothetical protein
VLDRLGFCGGDLSGRFPRDAGKPGSQSAGQHHCAVETADNLLVPPCKKWKSPIK